MSPAPVLGARAPRESALLAAGTGATHALLFLLSFWLLSASPGPEAPDAEIVRFYASGEGRRMVIAGLYLMPFAGISFIWLCMALRAGIRAGSGDASDVVSGIQLASAILYVAMLFAAAVVASVTAAGVELAEAPVDPALARQLQLGRSLLIGFAIRMAAMFVFTTSRLGRASGVLPHWFARIGFPVALFLLLSPTLDRRLALVFPGWLLALCVLLVARERRDGRPEGR